MLGGLFLLRSLTNPGVTLRSGLPVSRIGLLLALLLPVIIGGIAARLAADTDLAEELLLRREIDRLDALMLNAPPSQLEEARATVEAQVERSFTPSVQAVAVATEAVVWVILYYELWLLLILLAQFAGGEERELDGKRHRRSQYLVLLVLQPLAWAQLVSGLLLAATGSSMFEAAATYTEYQQAAQLPLSLAYVFRVNLFGMAPVWRFLLTHGTNPFAWWAVYVFVDGAGETLRLSVGRSLAVAGIVLILLSLQFAGVEAARGFFG